MFSRKSSWTRHLIIHWMTQFIYVSLLHTRCNSQRIPIDNWAIQWDIYIIESSQKILRIHHFWPLGFIYTSVSWRSADDLMSQVVIHWRSGFVSLNPGASVAVWRAFRDLDQSDMSLEKPFWMCYRLDIRFNNNSFAFCWQTSCLKNKAKWWWK